jgi:hypothetical protein
VSILSPTPYSVYNQLTNPNVPFPSFLPRPPQHSCLGNAILHAPPPRHRLRAGPLRLSAPAPSINSTRSPLCLGFCCTTVASHPHLCTSVPPAVVDSAHGKHHWSKPSMPGTPQDRAISPPPILAAQRTPEHHRCRGAELSRRPPTAAFPYEFRPPSHLPAAGEDIYKPLPPLFVPCLARASRPPDRWRFESPRPLSVRLIGPNVEEGPFSWVNKPM